MLRQGTNVMVSHENWCRNPNITGMLTSKDECMYTSCRLSKRLVAASCMPKFRFACRTSTLHSSETARAAPVSLLSSLVGLLLHKGAVLPPLDLLFGPAEEAPCALASLTRRIPAGA